jgi:hypothetical protein
MLSTLSESELSHLSLNYSFNQERSNRQNTKMFDK